MNWLKVSMFLIRHNSHIIILLSTNISNALEASASHHSCLSLFILTLNTPPSTSVSFLERGCPKLSTLSWLASAVLTLSWPLSHENMISFVMGQVGILDFDF